MAASLVTASWPVLLAGCQGGGLSAESREAFQHFTPEQNYDIALHSEDADARRRAIVRIARSRRTGDADAFRVLDVAARTDPNSQVRCAAIRALRGVRDPRPVDVLLAILNPKAHPGEALPATPAVRWDATESLVQCCENGYVSDERRTEVLDVLVGLLLHDSGREVKMAAARGLGALPDERSLRALVASLRHKDFGIAYEARQSLVRLTGQPYEYDADAWESWLKSTSAPFARGARAESRPAAGRSSG